MLRFYLLEHNMAAAEFKNVYAMLENAVSLWKESTSYCEKINGQWVPTTWAELKDSVDTFAMALLARGFAPHDTLCILSANRLIWPVSHLGAIAAGGIAVGIYPSSAPEQCAYILNHAGAKFVVVDTQTQLQKILKVLQKLPALQNIIVKEAGEHKELDSRIVSWEDFLQFGCAYRNKGMETQYRQIARSSQYDDTVVIVYTSGTTGNPKGACLSNRYILASCEALSHTVTDIMGAVPLEQLQQYQHQQFVSLSFLPFCHVAECISGMYFRMYSGVAAYLVDDAFKLYENFLEVSPHTFAGVPRFFEKIYAKVMNDVETGQGYNKQDFAKAITINKKAQECRRNKQPVPPELTQEIMWAETNICKKIRSNLGKRILACSSGGGPIPKEILDFFEYAANLPICEAYGLTECVCCAFNTPQAHKANSVGKPMYQCQIKIAEDGEILASGPLLFSGYYKDDKETQETIDSQGWLHTGDIGKLDEEGFLFITGRKKEFIKTSTGKKIAPLLIENLCKRNHLISNVMVYGDNKKYLTALITLNPLELIGYAKAHGLSYASYAALTRHPHIAEIVSNIIQQVNDQVSSTEQIKKYHVLDRDFTVEDNEITPTGKIKRNVLSQKFQDVLESMYTK